MNNGKKLILTIDDDANIRMLLDFVLRKKYEVMAVEDGMLGMSWLSAGNIPDLIIADVEMPRIDGYEFLKGIRESGFFRDIPVIMLSGHESAEIKIKCIQQGADEYCVKPFNPEDILEKIDKVINHAKNRTHA